MKKWFDKYIAQSSKSQMLALALAFVILIVVGGIVGFFVLEKDNPDSAKFGFRGTWGLMQCVDGGFVDATISSNTKLTSTQDGEKISKNAPFLVVVLSLGFWLGGMVLISFFTGAATNFLDVRREKIITGDVDYFFKKKYILIVGFDYQGNNLVKTLLEETRSKKTAIVVLTDSSVEEIHSNLLPDIQPDDAHRLFVMRKDITMNESYESLCVTGAEEIYIIGDGDAVGRDGKSLQALDALVCAAKRELGTSGQKQQCNPCLLCKLFGEKHQDKPIKLYLHIEDSMLYSYIRSNKLPADEILLCEKTPAFDLEVFNYYESWAWECWSNKTSTDGTDDYLPIRHIPGTNYTELFIIGAGRMGCAMANFAMPLMNYGENGKHSKITLFDLDNSKKSFLPDKECLDALPEVEVVFEEMDGCSDEANAIILEAARRKDTSVTIVIAISDPASSMRAYMELSNRLRRENVSILIWQATQSHNIPNKTYLRMGGKDSVADRTTVRYFGMTDRLPWKNLDRSRYGMAINYYYSCWYSDPKAASSSPKATDQDFVKKAQEMWNHAEPDNSEFNGVKAITEWLNTPRWKRWASVNSGDTFREKAVLFPEIPYAEAAEKVLKAEHNRWWTDRLLSGWLSLTTVQATADGASQADKAHMVHKDMIPFEDLLETERDKDKINIAAMAVFKFFK